MSSAPRDYSKRLRRYALSYSLCFVLFVIGLAVLERLGLAHSTIGYVFVFATVALYACVGLAGRTADIDEYFVAGRRVPAFFNGLATGADWISAASFISLAGTIYLGGFDGLVYVMGWTGGYCLVGLLLAPYLRALGQYTVPDFLGLRYGGVMVRALGAVAAVLCSFVYVVAQIYGVGLIASRFTGVDFGVGVFLGLAGILVCSFLGGMRAITWTQVAQYIVLIIAYMTPAVMLSMRHADSMVPQIAYGRVLASLQEKEHTLAQDPKEREVRGIFEASAHEYQAALDRLPQSWADGRETARLRLQELRESAAPLVRIRAAERVLENYPRDSNEARARWSIARDAALARAREPYFDVTPFPAASEEARQSKRNNFLALLFCLMVGTAGLPHILTRYQTTPSINETRKSVAWSVAFIALLYLTSPAIAVLVKYDVVTHLVGLPYSRLPAWVASWAALDRQNPLISIVDVNHDGIVQLAEINFSPDVFMLAVPEITGLPYVVSGLVAAGGLAAALSTADGLLLTIASAISHDIYHKLIDPQASAQKRVTLSKITLLLVALTAAFVTSLRPGDILAMVGAAFSIAASAFVPALLLGIFWKRANRSGALAGMIVGLGVCLYYMAHTYPFLASALGYVPAERWWGIEPISSGIFGVPAGCLTIVLVSLFTSPPDAAQQQVVAVLREPPTH